MVAETQRGLASLSYAMELCLVSADGDLRHVACRGDLTVLDVQRDVDPLEQLLEPGCFSR
jgi:hypothetical protein